jgi:type III secretion system YscD/HrpQ family protein
VNALLDEVGFEFDSEIEQESAIELRVLQGAQMGSCLALSPGEYLLGSGDDCAVMLVGPNVAGRHAVLRFDGNAALIEPHDGIVRNAHGDDIEAEQELVLGLPVELGGVIVTVDHTNAPWPEPESIMVLGNAMHTIPGRQQQQSDTAGAASDEEVPAVEPDADDEKTLASSAGRQKSNLPRRLLLILLLLATSGFGAFSWLNLEKKHAAEAARTVAEMKPDVEQPPAAASKTLADFPKYALTLAKVNSEWRVAGYVPTNAEYTALRNALAAAAPAVQVKVAVEEHIVRDVKALLDGEDFKAYVKVESAVRGLVLLSGAAVSADEVDRIRSLVMDKVPGVQEVRPNFLLPEQLRSKLKERIAAAGLSDRLVVRREGEELRLAGRLSPDEIRRWEEVLLDFSKEYGNVLPVRATVTRVLPKPPIGVQVIVGGAMPYIVTESGEHVNQGGNVDGHTLMSIKDGEVVFEGSQRIRIAR